MNNNSASPDTKNVGHSAEKDLNSQELLSVAITHLSNSALVEAKEACDQILKTEPKHPMALHILGIIFDQMGNTRKAIDLVSEALKIAPRYAEAHYNLGNFFKNTGNSDAALKSYQNAISINSDFAMAYNNSGVVLHDRGELESAIAKYRKALLLKSDYAEAHFNLALTLQTQGKVDEAVHSYRTALSLNHTFVEAINNLSLLLQDSGHLDEAETGYRRAISIDPEYAEAHYNLHSLLLAPDDMGPAVQCLQRALEISPDRSDYHFMLGMLLDYSETQDQAGPHLEAAANGTEMDGANLDAWNHIKSSPSPSSRITIIGSRIQAYKISLDASPTVGLIMEFGVQYGTSIRQIADLVSQEVHGFDSFEGLPEDWHSEPKGSYSTYGVVPKVPKNVILHVGWFEDSLPTFLENHSGPARLIHIDCDTYASTKVVLETLAERVVAGTVLVFDEFIGNLEWRTDEFKAFEEISIQYGWKFEYLCFSFMTKQTSIQII